MAVLEHIKQLAMDLAPEEKDALAQFLAESNSEEPPEKPKSLRGDWSYAFSADLDARRVERNSWRVAERMVTLRHKVSRFAPL